MSPKDLNLTPDTENETVSVECAKKGGEDIGHIAATTAKFLDNDTSSALLALVRTTNTVADDLSTEAAGAYAEAAFRTFFADIDGKSELSDEENAAYGLTSLFGLLDAALGEL